ncbi:rhodanese like protein [Plasmodium gonderi]|uniref:Rhodanese like protein n=1 Tax=Plasmodium gonderi TaxID=77519 RepID=A0A1Y1JNI3_PLAGO|nr:rhodanese like protein [Plasmodium gonderi]GAW82797.1 rhodanese like protein [Plasmodium gonderi]
MEKNTFKFLIETHELQDLIKSKKEHLLFDTSWYNTKIGRNKDCYYEHDQVEKIEGSINFNSVVTSNENLNFSFFFPSQDEFFGYLKKLLITNEINIKKNSLENVPIIFYEKDEIFYAPRIWFMFKMYGFQTLYILNGGLNKWLNEQRDVITIRDQIESDTQIWGNDNKVKQVDKIIKEHIEKNKEHINDNLKNSIYSYSHINNFIVEKEKENGNVKHFVLVDTRPNKSFSALLSINEKEKVNNFIPFSINIPYHYFINSHNQNLKYFTFKNELEIRKICDKYELLNEDKTIISTCNKGISACILLFLLHMLNKPLPKLILYHGSFVDYKYHTYSLL